jgi:hypothetical protein
LGREQRPKATAKAKAKAIDQSFRLRLHSGLRQSGRDLGMACNAQAKAWAYPRSNGNSKNRRGKGVRSPPVARSGGLRMGPPSVLRWVEENGQRQKQLQLQSKSKSEIRGFFAALRMTGCGGGWRKTGNGKSNSKSVVRAVYVPPFARARRMGHPSVLGWVEENRQRQKRKQVLRLWRQSAAFAQDDTY